MMIFNLVLPLIFSASAANLPQDCRPGLEAVDPITRFNVTCEGVDAIDALMRSLPPDPGRSVALRTLRSIIRRVRYGRAPDIRGDILTNLHELKSTFEAIARSKSTATCELSQSQTNALQVSATGDWRRLSFPHGRFTSSGEQTLSYAQRMELKHSVKDGDVRVSLTLTLAVRGNLGLLAPEDHAMIERARTDNTQLLPGRKITAGEISRE